MSTNTTTALDRRSFCTLAAAGSAALMMSAPHGASASEEAAPVGAQLPLQYIIDVITPQVGEAKDILEEYRTIYAPCLEEGGAVLLHTLVDPIMWLDHDYNNLVFIWEIAGGPLGLWEAGRHYTPEAGAWVAELREHCAGVQRYRLAAPEDLEALDQVSYEIV